MSSELTLHRPPSLRAVLGNDLDLEPFEVHALAEEALVVMPRYATGERAVRATWDRERLERLLDSAEEAGVRTDDVAALQRWATQLLWSAELLEDEALRVRFVAALPDPLRARYSKIGEQWRNPHPLERERPDTWWNCAACGHAFEEGAPAVRVGEPDDRDELLPYAIRYCPSCIRSAASSLTDEE